MPTLTERTASSAIERETRLGKYLTFALGEEDYGLEILKVRELIGLMDITRVPRMPDFVRGVINLRGKVIPVVDLRLKFGMAAREDTVETCIIVVDLVDVIMGVAVDKVSEVLDINESDIEETPSFGIRINTEFIMGIGKAKGKVIILLDIQRVLTAAEIVSLSEAAKIY